METLEKVTAYGWTMTGRYIGTCRQCKQRHVVQQAPSAHVQEVRITCDCGQPVQLEQVWGSERPEVKCGGSCRNAKRPACECSCGGENHGGG